MIDVTDQQSIRRITINYPERRNAVPPDGWAQLAEAFEGFEDSDQRALIVTGEGEDFCSGADLAGAGEAGASVATGYGYMGIVGRAVNALHGISKPVVAGVDGVAVGAGMNLALGCDFVIATPRARFAEIFVKRGLTMDFGGTWLLPRVVGLQKAKELALTGRILSGEEAHTLAIVGELVDPEALAGRTDELATELAAGAPLAQRFIKTGIGRSFDLSFEQALAYESQAQAICLASDDAAEGFAAFLEKRDPRFTGR